MKKSVVRCVLCLVSMGVILGLSARAFADDDGDLLKQSEDLLKQAWNPGGDPPSNDQRTELLGKAIALAQKEPDHRLARNRVAAIQSMKAALEEIKAGDPNNKANEDMQDADRDLRDAIAIAESH